LGEDIDLAIRIAPGLYQVKADPSQIEQVIMNLAVNARDAMVDGGRLTIETANVTLDDNYGQQRHIAFTPGDYVMLAVTDTGTGMDEATKARLFEPFFTTKELGKGTGLGLATVYGIVKQSGGYVWVYSELGKGTAFKVYLPKVRGVTDVAKPDHAAKPLATGTETILLVEDSESLRELNREMLTSLGYDVLSAENGASAIQIAESHKSVIHLVLTDVVMPGINGRELVDRLIGIRPDLKIMYMSGYTDDVILHRAILKPGIAFLQKPFSKEELAARIREVIDTLRS
jgi:CheY-like chemotaxis protein